MQKTTQIFNVFDLEAFFTNLIKNILLLSIIDSNYFKKIIYIYIFFLIWLPNL